MSWREKLYLATFYPIDEMRKRAYKLVGFVFCFCVVTAGFAFHAAQASPEKDGEIIVPSRVPYSLTQMLLDHPNIQQSVANACQAIFVLGQRRAETKLNLSATISGERQLASNFNTGNDDSDNSRSRAYNRSNDNLYDLEVAARYRLIDWGVGAARIRSQERRLQAQRLGYDVALSSVAQDILQVMIQIETARSEVIERTQLLADIAPHVVAIEAQGAAGSIGVADVRQTKLNVVNAEITLERAQRRLDDLLKELQLRHKLTVDEALPLLKSFLTHRGLVLPEIPAKDWFEVRVLDARIAGEQDDLLAIQYESYPRIDSVFETNFFDVADYESEYQLVGRLELSMPLYDGGSNKAREQEKSWQVKELFSQREEQIRAHRASVEQGKIAYELGQSEIAKVKNQIADITARHESLNALLGNSLVSRQELIQLLSQLTEKTIELSQLKWQQEFTLVRLINLANALTSTLGVKAGENKC